MEGKRQKKWIIGAEKKKKTSKKCVRKTRKEKKRKGSG